MMTNLDEQLLKATTGLHRLLVLAVLAEGVELKKGCGEWGGTGIKL